MKDLSITELKEEITNSSIPGKMLTIINIFLESINDWPIDVLTLSEYEKQVAEFIKNDTTKKNIEEALNRIDFNKHSWESESLTEILEVFQFEKDAYSLKEIIERMKI